MYIYRRVEIKILIFYKIYVYRKYYFYYQILTFEGKWNVSRETSILNVLTKFYKYRAKSSSDS